MRLTHPSLLLLALTACTNTQDDASSTGTSSTTADPTTSEGDLNERELGTSATPACVAAKTHASALFAAAAAGDANAASAAYSGTPLQTYMQQLDALSERSDDADITTWLSDPTPALTAAAAARVQVAYARHMRDSMGAVETGAPDKYAAWDEAHCLWEAALRPLALAADEVTWHTFEETIAADIDAAFADGHDAIAGEPPYTNIDDWRLPPNKQRAEKSLFRAVQRVLVELAGEAQAAVDPVAARRALELFAIIEDRLDGRNTPGIAQIKAMLAGDPATIDPQQIVTELDLAFAKRTRNYADLALTEGAVGVPTGYKGAVEGHTYALLLVPGMQTRLGADFSPKAYLDEWAGYAQLVRDGDDAETLAKVSQRLVDQTCAYQAALGVTTCTNEGDELE